MNRSITLLLMAICIAFCWNNVSWAAIDIKNLPPEETSMLNTVDPWGLAFGDQLSRFQSYFEKNPKADFVIGYTHNLVKIWQNKYWFRGTAFSGEDNHKSSPIYAVTGSTASFQIAILPKTGAESAIYSIEVKAPLSAKIYREEFVKTGNSAYPGFVSEYWPDPLVSDNTCQLSGLNAGVFLVEIPVPENCKLASFICSISVSGKDTNITCHIPVTVAKLKLKPKNYPLTAWFNKQQLSDKQMQDMCILALDNHLQPLTPDYLWELWKSGAEEKFTQFVQLLLDRGQTVFHIRQMDDELYQLLKKRGWLSMFMVYSNSDETDENTFNTINVPWAAETRKKYPGLKIFLASEYHPDMKRGCDIWLTDLSSRNYDPRTFPVPKKPDMWHYYCHLPINFQMRAPLTMAPNMQIDNSALEHRLALWMSWHYGAKGIFIYMGNGEWRDPAGFWKMMDVSYLNTAYLYPYGGIHHGNGFLIYPPKEDGGDAIPSLRLKILRDGMEDIALFEAVKTKYGNKATKILSPVPEVFSHPHYYDTIPEALLGKREKILKWVIQCNQRQTKRESELWRSQNNASATILGGIKTKV